MLLEDAFMEYEYHCLARNYTKKTMINKRQEYKQLKAFLVEKRGITELTSIHQADMKAYLRYKQNSGLKPQSIQSMAKQVKAFFNWCVNEEYLVKSPMDKVALPKVPKLVLTGLTTNEVVKMMNSFKGNDFLNTRNLAILCIMTDCGLRAMEVSGLKEVNVRETEILVFGKGSKERLVFISPALKKILIKYERVKRQYFKGRIKQSDHYFLAYQGKSMSTVAVYNLVKESSKRVGIDSKRVSPHMFRHYFAVQSVLSGIDIYSLSKLLGHSDINITERYLRSLDSSQLSVKAISSSPLMNLHNVY
ncbi:tyrosine-type recombinase/integrase [Alkalihalobacillus trypoxylicola]|uniref:Recombinase n=1 Tax=Alkalihalobacillus trypoxylicola TaxID=519424 RepID=A0A162F6Y5_9BACI|nr:tyrosine-type recombinase/integrase [Alkalihalobacillus trypoxylicola]KYG34932.1 recombinase [Alkalihalobacillus trypoxylicola]